MQRLLVVSSLWNLISSVKKIRDEAMAKSSALVELFPLVSPSTGPTPWTVSFCSSLVIWESMHMMLLQPDVSHQSPLYTKVPVWDVLWAVNSLLKKLISDEWDVCHMILKINDRLSLNDLCAYLVVEEGTLHSLVTSQGQTAIFWVEHTLPVDIVSITAMMILDCGSAMWILFASTVFL